MKKYNLFYSLIILSILVLSSNICTAKERPESFAGQGYVGILPDLTRDYEAKEETQNTPEIIPSKSFNSENEIKPTPRDNPTFVNIILKSEKTSQYVNDINEFIPMLESLYDMIENNSNVQVFNAKVYYFNKSVDFLREKYEKKPESQFISFKRLMELSLHAKSIALLRYEAEKYNPYLAYGSAGYIYNPNNITEQLEYLKTEIEQTIMILKESN
jgi:hypothetical protein